VGFRLNTGSTISSDMLIPSSSLDRNEREIAINVNSVTGVAGRVRPGDRVDILAVFGEVEGLPASVKMIDKDVRVVSIAGKQTVTRSGEGGLAEESVIPVTLALSPEKAMAVTYAAAFADEVRLVALPSDVGVDREGDVDNFDASDLGGKAVTKGESK
jgi:pilus assembly protein CpaB